MIVLGRHQPPRDPGPRAAAPWPLRPPRHGARARQGGRGRRSSTSTRARSRWTSDVDLDRLAATTPGMVGADLANLATRPRCSPPAASTTKVNEADFTDALEKIVLGAPRGIVLAPTRTRRTAYHESGHAIVGMLTSGADPVRKVSIIPRTQSLGVTISSARRGAHELRPRLSDRAHQGRARRPRGGGGRLRHASPPARSPTSSSSPGSRARWSAAGG